MPKMLNYEKIKLIPKTFKGARYKALVQMTCSVFISIHIQYFLNHLATFEYKYNIAGALIVCSSGGIGAAIISELT
jgi:hypothetical protein